MKQIFLLLAIAITLGSGINVVNASQDRQSETQAASARDIVKDSFALLIHTSDKRAVDRAMLVLDAHWKPEFIPQLLDIISVPLSDYTRSQAIGLLTAKTSMDFGQDINEWYYWLWNRPEQVSPGYSDFKGDLYGLIDPKFTAYFLGHQASARIRLDEVRWGGVLQDGIPPLRDPEMIPANQATYLDATNIVFGLEVNGDARAYPKRILAWHEMFTDTIGGVDIAGVYCTLCGTVIPFKTEVEGKRYELGTSGFLYRSNKLMYDQATQSLWSTVRGEPVIGPLAGTSIRLEHVSIVTTTWDEWRRRHPETTVLSLETGHRRNYGEGVAYSHYFATDQLMFNTPFRDSRLRNKQEVLALVFPAFPGAQLAIDTSFLDNNPLYTDMVGQQKVLVLTDRSGASRVYDPKQLDFIAYDRDSSVTDSRGKVWKLSESGLTSPDGKTSLDRLPSRRAFWFGWYAAFPDTRLVN